MTTTDHMFAYMASTGQVRCMCGWTQEVPEGTTREQARELWRAHAETPAAGTDRPAADLIAAASGAMSLADAGCPTPGHAELGTALTEARARAKVDGGEWQWGVRYESTDGAHESWDDWTQRRTRDYVAQYNNINSRLSKATLIRQWRGPVEPVTDDGSGT